MDLHLHLIYNIHNNIAKIKEHALIVPDIGVEEIKSFWLIKWAPHHPWIPVGYQLTVLIGNRMETCSYILVRTNQGMDDTVGSTCHGA